MTLTARGSLPARLRDSARARYLTAGSLVVISAVSVPMASGAFSDKQRVLAATADLSAGHVLTRSDFTMVEAEAPSSFVVPVTEMTQVVGKTLRVEVPEHALLTAGDVGAFPPSGMAEVAFKVAPGEYPPELTAGQRVAVMPPAATQDGAQPAATATPDSPVVGQVLSISPDPGADDASSVVALLVPVAAAGTVTAAEGGSLVALDANGDAS